MLGVRSCGTTRSGTPMAQRILSGIQPSGKLHIGNYFGALRQFIELQDQGEALYFIADYHALTSLRQGELLRQYTLDVALDYLALGLDPAKATLFKQSDIPEVTELMWYLGAVAPMGLLEKAHSFKDKTAKGIPADVGLFTYPVLMAADILLYDSDVVPVGKDQIQHVEITRDLAVKLNLAFVPGYDPADPEAKEAPHKPGLLKLPKVMVREDAATVPGLDGQKMSKSYNNTLELFADDATIKKKIMSIKSDSTPVEAPKDPASNPIHPLLMLFASESDAAEINRTYREGGKGYGHYKMQLLDLFHARFDAARARRKELENDRGYVDQVLKQGAEKARGYAVPVIERIRTAVGTR
ncbi:MAG: tryptophan--tRNA ligase [Polyangiaceae bacterium]